jgi:L-serine dehydratase
MESIKEIYRIGQGPSSSHTMGPRKAATQFRRLTPGASAYEVTLYGSLAATGKGHLTDVAILDVLQPVAPTTIVWQPEVVLPFHPNGMKFVALDAAGATLREWTVYSVGGGALSDGTGGNRAETAEVYDMQTLGEIQAWCNRTGHSYWEYVDQCEGPGIWVFLNEIWETMKAAVERGVVAEGVLPGGLGVRRKASEYLIKSQSYSSAMREKGKLYAYALATAEENAAGGIIVTAPTCGSCGVLPGVLYYLWKEQGFGDQRLLRALATAGLVGAVVKRNASISGAEVGCQGEVGVACAMAAAAACQLFGGTVAQIEYAAEMGLEHHLGLTCDPVCGLVQIPCIERNAYAASRALDCSSYAGFGDGVHRVSFDKVVEVMKETGHDLPSLYKETSVGGLAKQF